MSTYPPIPRHLFDMRLRWLDQAQAHTKDPEAPPPDHALLAAGLGEWGGPLQPTSPQDDGAGSVHDMKDGNGIHIEAILRRKKPVDGSILRSSRRFDPEGFFVLQAHIFPGAGLKLGYNRRGSTRKDYLTAFSQDYQVRVIRLITGVAQEKQVRESIVDYRDYRRAGFPPPRDIADVTASGLRSRGAYAGREFAISQSLRLFDERGVAEILGITRADYEQMLRDGYLLLDRLPLRDQQRRPPA